ncbi:copper resistance protein NlpE [Flavobacterium sp. CBA20B-1]|uniref:copper resistance protein NlpE n=1 Tax=unclassified Flavobacterium TaxID=196869 RepID=UPI00222466BD|nr:MULTISPECIES: copper resistance protein NlpE [unclassified Flavobacterium]WCM43263.1 copper resistance protein NlpE [Flavobacterium sp. CBA20B-1]
MKKIIFTISLLGGVLISCNKEKTTETTVTTDTLQQQTNASDTMNHDGHNANNSLDWAGTYEATLPCADCPGIKTTITLKTDGTYEYTATYLDKDFVNKSAGEIMWHNNGSVVHLKDKDNKENDMQLKVIENGLIGLDTEGNEIEGALKEHYNYKKVM